MSVPESRGDITEDLIEHTKGEVYGYLRAVAGLERAVRDWENYEATPETVFEHAKEALEYRDRPAGRPTVDIDLILSSLKVEEERSLHPSRSSEEELIERAVEGTDVAASEVEKLRNRQKTADQELLELANSLTERYAGDRDELEDYLPHEGNPTAVDGIIGVVKCMENEELGDTHFDETHGSELY